ncbi:MAG TPA: hypothetical protein VM618_11125, partial [Acidimicrobiia bacterium]|nr:hypothetical protein [Acidimicrobiia bacterium]
VAAARFQPHIRRSPSPTAGEHDVHDSTELSERTSSCSASASGGTVGASIGVSVGGTTEVRSESSVESCTSCSPAVGDGDLRMWGWNRAAATSTSSIPFTVGVVSGSLASANLGPTTASVDDDSGPLVTASSRLQAGALQLAQISGAPLTCAAGVSVAAADVTATAAVGQTAPSPSVAGTGFDVTVCDTLLGSIVSDVISVVPGETVTETATATFNVVDLLSGTTAAVTLDTTVASQPATTSCGTGNPSCVAPITYAETRLANWLVVTTRIRVVQGGVTVADLTVEADYGTLVAAAEWTP